MKAYCEFCGVKLYANGPKQNTGSGDGKHFFHECRNQLMGRVEKLEDTLSKAIEHLETDEAIIGSNVDGVPLGVGIDAIRHIRNVLEGKY